MLGDAELLLPLEGLIDKETELGRLRKSLADLDKQLGAIRAKLIDVNMKQAQLWPSGLHEKLNALLDVGAHD